VNRDCGRLPLVAGAIAGAIAVAAGAFGAHGLKATLAELGQGDNWETACRYGMIHALALVATGLLARLQAPPPRGLVVTATWCLLLGTAIFSGFLGTLALSGLKILGAIVPIGGGLMIAGWLALALAAARLPPA
jgi:uncharacterized membrane protein YgdD (TMEM256/DUF423 family)